ncbi:MAG: hypothetical protein R3F47_05740 [Gammaproteobacteria bacterium]
MKIENATLRLVSGHRQHEREQWQKSASASISSASSGRPVALEHTYAHRENVRLESSQSAYLYSRSQISHAGKPDAVQVVSQETLLQSMVSHAFSRDLRISSLTRLDSSASDWRGTGPAVATQANVSFGQSYRYESEQQSTLTIEGRLDLADNRSVDFVLHTRLDNRLLFESGSGEFARAALRTDPLILNLQGGATQLTDAAFTFDLDGDGQTESVSLATGGSGFIAFDRNGDGAINDGRELFGTRTGNGFAELAQFDDDGNGFIDEADAIFQQLQFWSRDENGNDRLQRLSELGIGAIGLDSADTPLILRGQSTQELGIIRSTGFFVREDGVVGTVQQVDLTRRDTDAEAAFVADFGNAQFVPEDPATPPEPQNQLEAFMDRLTQLRNDFMARLEQTPAEEADSKTLLEQLVDMLEQQIRERAGEPGDDTAAEPAKS